MTKHKIDARNIPCPGPVIQAKKVLSSMEEGVLEVLVDNSMAVQNLTKLASYLQLESGSAQLEEDCYQVTFSVKGKDAAKDGGEEPAKSCRLDGVKYGTLVVISADHMGEGDDVLGTALMKGFLYALTELEQLPETILLYNGGARLSVEGSEALEDLRLLESQGVEILTCGTCLNHYGISDRLAVGAVTNMYAIAETMMAAKSIIKP